MYENLPFFSFGGFIKGIDAINILLYEIIAFLIIFAALYFILRAVLVVTGLIEKILKAFHAAEDIHQFKQTVKVEDIASNEFDISIQKYVFIKDDQDEVESLSTAILNWHKTKEKVHYHYNTLMDLI